VLGVYVRQSGRCGWDSVGIHVLSPQVFIRPLW